MAEILVLRPTPFDPDAFDWIVVNDAGVPLGEPGRGGSAAAAAEANGRKVIGLVPSVDVLRTRADVPVKGAGKILQAVPYALEEQLADDIDTLHFAAGERSADGSVPVAVVRHDKMDEWRERLAVGDIDLAALHTEGDALGHVPGTTVLLAEADRVTLRDVDEGITTSDIDNAGAMLELWFASQAPADDDAEKKPVNLLIYATAEAHAALEPTLDRLRADVETLDVKLLPDGALPRLAAQLATEPGINLLQGTYARRSNYRAYWPAWKLSAALLGAFTIVAVGTQLARNAVLENRSTALDGAIESAFRYTFPDVRNVQDPRAQFEAKIRSLGRSPRAEAGPDFLDALLSVSRAIDADAKNETAVQAIDFRGTSVELRVLAPNVEALDRVQKAISQGNDLAAEIQSANPEGDKVLGRIKITMGA